MGEVVTWIDHGNILQSKMTKSLDSSDHFTMYQQTTSWHIQHSKQVTEWKKYITAKCIICNIVLQNKMGYKHYMDSQAGVSTKPA